MAVIRIQIAAQFVSVHFAFRPHICQAAQGTNYFGRKNTCVIKCCTGYYLIIVPRVYTTFCKSIFHISQNTITNTKQKVWCNE